MAVFDPLDGSSNVDAGVPTGTIFGIFQVPDDGGECVVCDDEEEEKAVGEGEIGRAHV